MLTDRIDRRDFLTAATGFGLSFVTPALSAREASRRGVERPKSFVTFWLDGGPSQLETWDPHPGTLIGGPTKAIKTTIPGVQFASHFPRTAEHAHRLSILRSLVSKEGDHARANHQTRTGYRPDASFTHPSLGAIAACELPDVDVDLPLYVAIGSPNFPTRGGYLGDQFNPFQVNEVGRTGQNLEPHVGVARQARRLDGLNVIHGAFQVGRTQRVEQTLHQQTVNAALRMMRSDQLHAFKIDEEPAQVKDAYGSAPLGRYALLARRLLESGVRAIEVVQSGFDTHANNFRGHETQASILDLALSAFLADLVERDLFKSTIVLVMGEFGRSPKINALDGRDHWTSGFSCLVGGGGLKSGLVIGATDPTGQKNDPVDPIPVNNLCATILKALSINYTKEVVAPAGRPVKLSDGEPIAQLFG